MAENSLPLMTFYKGWNSYQRNLVEVIAPLSTEQLALPASSHHWTIGMLAQHIIGNRVWWFQMWMGQGSPDLAPLAHWDPSDEVDVPPLDAAALVTGLESTWSMISQSLTRWTGADLEQVFPVPSAMKEEERQYFSPSSMQWIIWHVLEHEIHHGGELSLALGNYGLLGIYGNI
ncbi:hypothetical protein KDA_62760 [Dictyobacter alpinus]|uniref:DinB-like domain-containing protein n=1 Tax=Dictyobacter alpinus TaxID=2014873 RepID=A0A402BHS4_9CHLR|nr:DinB family protein [Dictyobacter alpinus]GCE30792.1 hypothetical protein KDA_62760 [Dictyobacter alpinus]